MTGRDVARLVRRGSQPAVAEALDRLTSQGVVHRDQVGRAFLHSLNRRHLAAGAVEILAGMRTELFTRLERTLSAWQKPAVHASVFGSVARGDGGPDSDVDLFLVRPAKVAEDDDVWRDQVSDLTYQVLGWTGNETSVVELGRREISRFLLVSAGLVGELRSDAITVSGTPIGKLLGKTA
jgi:hypothetical protein